MMVGPYLHIAGWHVCTLVASSSAHQHNMPRRLEKQKRQALRALGSEAATSPDMLQANGASAVTPPDAAGRSPADAAAAAAAAAAVATSAAVQPLPLPLLNGSQVCTLSSYSQEWYLFLTRHW